MDRSSSTPEFLRLDGARRSRSPASPGAPCSAPTRSIVPYVEQPERSCPASRSSYATALLARDGCARRVWPRATWAGPRWSRGTRAIPQAWEPPTRSPRRDPDPLRSRPLAGCHSRGRDRAPGSISIARWLGVRIQSAGGQGDAGLRILTETVLSPTLADQLSGCTSSFPRRVAQYEPGLRRWPARSHSRAFGDVDSTPVYHLDKADVILALDADFLTSGTGSSAATLAILPRDAVKARPATDGSPGNEPALCRRVYTFDDGCHGRPPPRRAGTRYRRLRCELDCAGAESRGHRRASQPAGSAAHDGWISRRGERSPRNTRKKPGRCRREAAAGCPRMVHA